MKCDDEGPFRQIYAVGRAGSRTPDPYDSQGVQLQVRVDLQLDMHTRIMHTYTAVYTIFNTRIHAHVDLHAYAHMHKPEHVRGA